MKRLKQWKKEKGDIALIAIFAVLVFLVLMALVVDGGLLYYRSAKLQNAVDAAVVGVAQHMEADDNTKDYWAEHYLKENGFDKKEYGDKMEITIEEKGSLDEQYSEVNDDAYVSDVYVKLNVKISTSGIFGALSGYRNISGDEGGLNKTGYAKIDVNYVDMPQALNYTIFGGNTTKSNQYKQMTVQINGRADGNLTTIVNAFTNAINGINSKIIQPIIEFIGGTGNYNDLISPSLSTAITNGDVHSNSDINIGVQALNASRTKDGLYTGDNVECTCISVCIASDIDMTCPVCSENYSDCEGDTFTYDDYNQVTYTAVGNIYFSNAKLANSSFISRIFDIDNDRNSHIYVQNQQYLEQTQAALNIINTMDFSTVTATTLSSEYEKAAEKYLLSQHRVSDEQKQAIIDQKDNLRYNANGTYSLFNQKMIVYDVTNNTANKVMVDMEDGTTISDLLQEVVDAGIDTTHDMEPHVTVNSINHYDSASSSTSYNIVFTKKNNNSTATLEVSEAAITNRNVKNMTTVPSQTTAGYRFAVARTFREQSEYIDIPNMKPYFVRQINRSVKNATTNKDSGADSSTESATSIKKAVANLQKKMETFISSKNTMAAKKGTVISNEEKTDGTYSPDNEKAYYDGKYASDTALTAQDTSPIFRYNLKQRTPGGDNNTDASNLVLTEYGNNDPGHTTFEGEKLFEDGVLRTPEKFINEFRTKNEGKYGLNAVTKFFTDSINGKYGPTRVNTARNDINANKSYDAFTNSITDKVFADVAPAEKDVFLTEGFDITTFGSTPGKVLDEKLKTDHTGWPGASMSGMESQEVTVTLPDVSDKGIAYESSYADPSIRFGTTVNVGTRSYNMKEMLFPSNTTGTAMTNYLGDNPFTSASNYGWNGTRNVTQESEADYRYNLYDGYTYNRVNQIKKGNYRMGFYVWPGATTRVNGVYLANISAWNGSRGIEIGKGSTLYIANDGYPNGNDTYHEENGVRYLYYNASTNGGNWMNIYEGGKTYINGSAYQKGNVNVFNNALLYVKGNLTINDGYELRVYPGAKVIVEGTLDVSSIRADAGSIIYCESVANGNDLGVLCADLYVKNDASMMGITLHDNSNLVIGGSWNTNGKGVSFGANSKIVVGGTMNVSGLPVPGSFSLCTGSDINYSSSDITLSAGQLLAANNLTLGNVTLNGDLYSSGQITVSDTSKSITAGASANIQAAALNANITNAGKMLVTGFGDANKDKTISNSGNIKVSVNANCKSVNNSGSMYVGGNLAVTNNVDNSNIFKVKNVTTGTSLTNTDGKVFQATGNITVGTDLTNSGHINCGAKITVNGTLSNTTTASVIQAGTDLEAAYISNNGQIRVGGAIISANNISCGGDSYLIANSLSTKTFYQNGITYIDSGSLTTSQPADGETDSTIGLLQIAGSIYVISGDVNVGGNMVGYSSGLLFSGGNITVVGSITFDHGVIKTDGDLTASEITAQGTLMQFDNISVSSIWNIREGATAYVTGDISAFKVVNHGTIYLDRSDVTVRTIYNYSTGVIICNGNLNVTSYIDTNRESVYNEGEIYVNGSLNAQHRIHVKGGKLYVRGDMSACNNTVYALLSDSVTNKKTFNFEGSCQIYVSGWLTSEGLTKGVYITGSGNAILSIYGRGHRTCFSEHIAFFDNDQTGSRVYLGTGSGWEFIQEGRQVTLSGQFDNNGQLFVYGNLTVNEAVNLSGNTKSFTRICGDLTEVNHSVKLNAGHTLIAYDEIRCTAVNVNDNSKLYGIRACNVSTGTYTIPTTGLVYCGPDTSVSAGGSKIQLVSNSSFCGQMYYPGSGSTVKLIMPDTMSGAVLATQANVNISALMTNITLTNHSRVYIGGTSTLGARCFINTSGELYLMQDITINSFAFSFNDGCINYFAPMTIGSGTRGIINSGQAIDWSGINYFDNSFVENCTDAVIAGKPTGGEIINDGVVKNRYVAIRINSGETHFSGDLTVTNTGLATRIATGAKLSCNNYNTHSVIYNQGHFVICNDLTYDCSSGAWSDKGDNKYDQGYCIRNGIGSSDTGAMMYIGGTKQVTVGGTMESYGKFYCKPNLWVRGYNIPGSGEFHYRTLIGQVNDTNNNTCRHAGKQADYAPHFSIKTGKNSKMHCGGTLTTHATVWTGEKSELSVEKDLGYGQAILNGGIFFVKGSIGYSADPYAINNIQLIWTTTEITEDIKGMISIANGFVENSKTANKDAVFYCGSSLQTGTAKDSDSDRAAGGAIQNFGDMYINGDLNSYSCTIANKMGINMVGISGHANSKTFVKGNAYSGGGFVTMINSIFMCGGDLESKRCARVGSPEVLNGDDDVDSASYCYVGRDMMTSTNGAVGNGDIGVPNSTWNYFIAYSNANIYVGNAFFTNSITVPKRNTTFAVDGKYEGNGQRYKGIISNIQAALIDIAFRLQGSNVDDIKFTVIGDGAKSGFEENNNKSQFYHLIVRGSAYVKETFRFRDMSDAYIYGDFLNYSDNTAQNIEIGKSLSFGNKGDDTWAAQPSFMTEKDYDRNDPNFDYNYEHAAYFFVEGSFKTRGRLSIYAGATLKVGGDCYVRDRIQLSHDGNVMVGGDLNVPGSAGLISLISGTGYIDAEQYADVMVRGDIKANNYVVMRENSLLFCGKKVYCGTSFEAKTNSTVFVCGSLQATLNTIKIRDDCKVFVGGNMTALRYIELGKHDDSYEDVLRGDIKRKDDNEIGASCICERRCSDGNSNAECPVCKDNNYGGCAAETSCTCSSKCGSQQAGSDCGCPVCGADYRNCMKESVVGKNELGDDATDKANGSTFYIGKALVSYSSYIREYGFSSVSVGKYVFANDYLTLRSNADMWVLPEAFENNTYKYVAYVSESDGTIIGNIIDKIKEAAYNIKDAVSLKNGSVYSLGELTLNKNASLMGTCDCVAYDQTLLSHDSLIYFGRDFNCSAASLKLDFSSSTPLVGFASEGATYTTLTCPNKGSKKHGKNYTMYCNNYDSTKTYVCDRCGSTIPTAKIKHNVTCPVTIYANRDINIYTTIDMKLSYLVASQGDVNMYDVYSNTDNIEGNIKQLPNAVGAFNGNINYFAMYGKICSMFYAPAGVIDLDGYYQEIWGSCIGDKVYDNTYYLNMHRFSNWRTMDLQIAESGSVYLVSEKDYDNAEENVDDDYLYTYNAKDESEGGASLFFPADFLEQSGVVSGGDNSESNNNLAG